MYHQTRPVGLVQPEDTMLREVAGLIENQKHDEAHSILETLEPQDFVHEAWMNYFNGVSLFAKKDFAKGLSFFSAPYGQLKRKPQLADDNLNRVVGRCLKKIGWFHRKEKRYEMAYAFHNIEYHLYLKSGSHLELHDAAISLDVDAYFMGDGLLDEAWLLRSIDHAKEIADDRSRFQSQGVSFNNLAGNQYSMEKFSEAEKAIRQSLECWMEYEKIAGSSENKVVWAHFGVGDVFHHWAAHLAKSRNTDSVTKKLLAHESYQESLKMGKTSLSAEDQQFIEGKIKEVGAIVCG